MRGPVLVEFGANWCGICRSFAPQLERLFQDYPEVQHIKIEDGKGKPLGRSFRVKLWPTLVFMRDGKIVHRLLALHRKMPARLAGNHVRGRVLLTALPKKSPLPMNLPTISLTYVIKLNGKFMGRGLGG